MSDFFTGANLPWVNYGCDVGANRWQPQGGIAALVDRSLLARTLGDLASAGAKVVRWFTFCDGRAGLRFEPREPTVTLDDRVFADFDAALDHISAAGLLVLPVLFDFSWCRQAQHVNGVQMGGHRRWFVSDSHRRALIDNVVAPVARRYANHRSIWAWDILNEPEWITFGCGTWEPVTSLSEEAIRRFLGEVRIALGTHTNHRVTVGSASARWLPLVRGLGLDFYQVHWYDHLERRAPLGTPVAEFRLDHPVILGEFPTRESGRSPEAIVRLAARSGYAGAVAWSSLATDAVSDGEAVIRAVAAAGSTSWRSDA
jgi:hypothetical protein